MVPPHHRSAGGRHVLLNRSRTGDRILLEDHSLWRIDPADATRARRWPQWTRIQVKPASNVQLSFGPSYSHELNRLQFVLRQADATATGTMGQRSVVADLSQNNLSMDTRLNWTVTPTLTLRLFGGRLTTRLQQESKTGDENRQAALRHVGTPGNREPRAL